MYYKEYVVDVESRKLIDNAPNMVLVRHDRNVSGIIFRLEEAFNAIDLSDSKTSVMVFYKVPSDSTTYTQPLTVYTSGTSTPYKYYKWDFGKTELDKAGMVVFVLCIQNSTANQDWNTRVARLQIADTLDHTDSAISPGTEITSSIDAAIESAVSAYVDSQIKTYNTEISAELAAETTRAETAEKTNADAITAEMVRAKAAEKTNADTITAVSNSLIAETTRAEKAEQANAAAIVAEAARADKAEKANAAAAAAALSKANEAMEIYDSDNDVKYTYTIYAQQGIPHMALTKVTT